MALNTPQLKIDLKAVYTDTYNSTGSADAALDAFIDAFTSKLDTWAKTASIIYTGGLIAGGNVVAGTFNGRLQ